MKVEERCPNESDAEVIEVIESLLDYIADECDENMHPAWCCAHQQKNCTGTADVLRAKALLAKLKGEAADDPKPG